MKQRATRRLVAILVADVVGFSRHMERDDAGTLAHLREIRESLIDPRISDNGGRIVKTTGDGMLVEFGSADASLRCAVDVQRSMMERNRTQADHDRIDFRIGINIGDIIVDGDDIFGDGVNVAARLEALAKPGGICVSGAVRDQVHGSLDIGFVDVGEQQVKNIARPIRTFAIDLAISDPSRPDAADPDGPPLDGAKATSPSPAPRAVSIGVMPLLALSDDSATRHRAKSIARDLSAMLARSSALISVVPFSSTNGAMADDDSCANARALNVRYLAEGEIRQNRDTTELGLRLVNGSTGEQVWSESASLDEADSPTGRSRALHAIVWHLSRSLIAVELRRVASPTPGESTPLENVLLALALDRTEPDVLERVRKKLLLLEDALRRDPNLVPALLGLAIVSDQQLDYDVHVDRDCLVRRMDELTSKAVLLNDSQPTIWFFRSMALMYMGQWHASLEACAKAIRLEPYSSMLLLQRAGLTTLSGRPSEALALVEQSIAMDPQGSSAQMRIAGEAHLLLGRYEEASISCEKAKGLGGDQLTVNLFLAASYAQLGERGKAAAARDAVLRLIPGYTVAIHKSKRYSVNPEYVRLAEEHFYEGLRKAGFAET